MPIVSIPDKGMRIRFPDDMAPEAIEQAIRDQVYGGYDLPETRDVVQGIQKEEEEARQMQARQSQVRDIASGLGRDATVENIKEYAAYAPYLATKALHGLTGWVFEPFQHIPTDKLSPIQKATVEALGGAEDVLKTATEYWEKATGEKDIKIPDVTIGRNEDGSLAFKPARPISVREVLGTTAEFTGEVLGPIKGALAAGHEAAELTAKYARPFYRSIMRGMVAGGLLGKGKKDKTLQNMALFGVFEPLSYSIGKIPEIPIRIKESTPWRRMTIKERGLVLQNLDDMIQRNPDMTEAEILNRWNNPQWRKEALERRMTPLSEAEGRPGAGTPVIRTSETGMEAIPERTGEGMVPSAVSRVTVPPREAPVTRIPSGPVMEAGPPTTVAVEGEKGKSREELEQLKEMLEDHINTKRETGVEPNQAHIDRLAEVKAQLKGKDVPTEGIASQAVFGHPEATGSAGYENLIPIRVKDRATLDKFSDRAQGLFDQLSEKIGRAEAIKSGKIAATPKQKKEATAYLSSQNYREDVIKRDLIRDETMKELGRLNRLLPETVPLQPAPEAGGEVRQPLEMTRDEFPFEEPVVEDAEPTPQARKLQAGPQEGENQELFSRATPRAQGKAKSTIEGFTPIPEGKRRSAILKKASQTLEVPIRIGKFQTRRGAMGVYKQRAEVIRLAKANDLETAVHEIGHHIEDLLGLPKRMPPQVRAMAYEGAMDPDREGFAEFLRHYVTDPEAARRGAPEFNDSFERALETQPDVRDIITEARNSWAVWQESPSVAKVHSFIQRGASRKAMPTISQVYTTVKDSLYPLQQAKKAAEKKGATVRTTEDPYIVARLTRGWARKAEQYLKYRPFQYDPEQGAVFSGKSLKAILEPIEKAGKTELLDTYLIAKRAAHDPRIQKGFSGILSAEDFKQTVRELEPEFKQTAKDLYEYSDQLLTFLTDSGRIGEETAEAIRSRNLFYVPFYRVMDWEAPLGGLSSKRFSNLVNPVKRLKGSSRDIYSPTESLVYNTFVTINAAELNRVGNALRKLADKPGMGEIIERIPARAKSVQMTVNEALKSLTRGIIDPVEKAAMKETLSDLPEDVLQGMVTTFRPNYTPKQNEALFYKDGDPVLYEVAPDLGKAIGNINGTDVGMLIRAMSYPAKWLRAGATTFSPEFAIRNPIRDQMTAYIQSKYGFTPGYDFLRGLYHMIGKTDLWQKFNASGAAHSAIVSLDRNYISKNLKHMLQEGTVKGMVKHPLELIQAISEYTEEATRVGEFARGIKKEGKGYEAMLKAGLAGREVSLDFARQGEATARAANLISAFWNARIEGVDKMYKTFKDNPTKAFAKVFLGVTLPSVLLWFAQKDDPYYQEIPPWRRTLFWNFVQHNEDGGLKRIISIPKPFEYGLIFGSIPETALDWAYTKDPSAFEETMKSVGQVFSIAPIPTGLVPIGEWWANKSWFFDRPIVPRGKEELEPVLQYGGHTAEVTKLVTRIMDKVTGLDKVASPAKIENLLRGYFGGFGRLSLEAGDALIKGFGIVNTPPDPAMTLADIPGIRAFAARYPSANTRSIETFYKRYGDMNRKWESQKQRVGVRGTGIAVEAPKKLSDYRTTASALSILRKIADQVYMSKEMDPKAKREALDNLYISMTNVARSALKRKPIFEEKKQDLKDEVK